MKYKGITIHKNKNCETWYTRFRKNGIQTYISARTQKECYNKLKQALTLTENNYIETLNRPKEKIITLQDWYDKWLNLYKIGKVKQDTIRDYQNLLNKINKTIKNKSIKAITLEDLITSINECQGKRQKQKLYDFLNALFKKAEDNELIVKNPVSKIDKPKHKKQHGNALTYEQEEKFIKECKELKYGDLYLVALYQGLRKGEVLAITDKDIDFENNTLTIDKAINRFNKFDTTKNVQSCRTMPLFDKTKQILLKYKNKKGRIFDISYSRIDTYTDKLKEAIAEDISIKTMRYTFITRCQEQNIPEFVIQSWCGHEIGSKVTKTVYTKFNAEDNYKYIDILNNSKFYSNSTQEK